MMNQHSLKNQGHAQKELTRTENLNSTSVSPSVVTTTTSFKLLAYTQILDPTVDLVISCSLVIYW